MQIFGGIEAVYYGIVQVENKVENYGCQELIFNPRGPSELFILLIKHLFQTKKMYPRNGLHSYLNVMRGLIVWKHNS